LYLVAHTDDMTRDTGDSFMRVVQKDLGVAVRAEQRIILEHIHVSSLRKIDLPFNLHLYFSTGGMICKSNPVGFYCFRTQCTLSQKEIPRLGNFFFGIYLLLHRDLDALHGDALDVLERD